MPSTENSVFYNITKKGLEFLSKNIDELSDSTIANLVRVELPEFAEGKSNSEITKTLRMVVKAELLSPCGLTTLLFFEIIRQRLQKDENQKAAKGNTTNQNSAKIFYTVSIP